jgi:hypothetical protein
MAAWASSSVIGDDDALASGEAIGLDHDGGACRVDVGVGGGGVREPGPGGGGGGAGIADLFREGLGAFEAGGGLSGAECQKSGFCQDIHSPVFQRGFRAYNNERNTVFFAKLENGSIVVDVNIRTFRDLRDPCVARSDNEPVAFGVLQDGPCQGVFTPAAAEDENVHVGLLMSRSGVAEHTGTNKVADAASAVFRAMSETAKVRSWTI